MIGIRLKELRKVLNITQEELGTILNVSKGNISKYENDILEPDLEKIKKLITEYNVNINWLLSGEGEIFFKKQDNELLFDDALTLLQDFSHLDDKDKNDILEIIKMRKLK